MMICKEHGEIHEFSMVIGDAMFCAKCTRKALRDPENDARFSRVGLLWLRYTLGNYGSTEEDEFAREMIAELSLIQPPVERINK